MPTNRNASVDVWTRTLAVSGTTGFQYTWDALPSDDRSSLVETLPRLDPAVLATVLESGKVTDLLALAARSDLDDATAAHLAAHHSGAVRQRVEANGPLRRRVLLEALPPEVAAQVADLPFAEIARLQPLPADVFTALLADGRDTVLAVLATNPSLDAADLRALVDTCPADDILVAALRHPNAPDELAAEVLALRSDGVSGATSLQCSLASELVAADPMRWVPVVLSVGDPSLAVVLLPYVSLLTPLGQALLVRGLAETDRTADKYFRPLFDSCLDPQVTALIGGWICAPGHTMLGVEAFGTAINELIDSYNTDGSPSSTVAAVVPGAASTDVLLAEFRGDLPERQMLHLAAAPVVPWAQIIALVEDSPRAFDFAGLKLLASRPDAPAAFGDVLLTWAPRLLIDAPVTSRAHVMTLLESQDRLNASNENVLEWALPTFDIDVDTLAETVAPVADLFEVLHRTAEVAAGRPATKNSRVPNDVNPDAAAWATKTLDGLAAKVAHVVGTDATMLRILETTGGHAYPGTFAELLDLTLAVSAKVA